MTSTTIYDHPLYYDILFGWDRTPEADFYEAALRRYGVARSERVLEVACGTGQVARRLAQRGWTLTGIDNRQAMVAFLREQAAEQGVSVETSCADMVSFAAFEPFGAAYNPLSSFRLLHEAGEVDTHLRSMASALRTAGIYVLDMEFLGGETADTTTTDETWEMTRGGVTVRASDVNVLVDDHGVLHAMAWGDGADHLRGYTAQSFSECVSANGSFSIEAWHPETGRGAEGVSEFSVDEHAALPAVGRTMVVLRRI